MIRPLAYRVGRKLYGWARGERRNDPRINGEYWLLGKFATLAAPAVTLFDIGANIGEWTSRAVECFSRHSPRPKIVSLESSRETYEELKRRFSSNPSVVPLRTAAGKQRGEGLFHVVDRFGGRNHLAWAFPTGQSSEQGHTEMVAITTFDELCKQPYVAGDYFVKSDTEGYDYPALLGASQSLSSGRIALWQFEYNHLWIANHASLLDVFDLIRALPYRLGRLLPKRVEVYDQWHPEMDRYFEGNYVLIRHDVELGGCCRKMSFNRHNCPARAD